MLLCIWCVFNQFCLLKISDARCVACGACALAPGPSTPQHPSLPWLAPGCRAKGLPMNLNYAFPYVWFLILVVSGNLSTWLYFPVFLKLFLKYVICECVYFFKVQKKMVKRKSPCDYLPTSPEGTTVSSCVFLGHYAVHLSIKIYVCILMCNCSCSFNTNRVTLHVLTCVHACVHMCTVLGSHCMFSTVYMHVCTHVYTTRVTLHVVLCTCVCTQISHCACCPLWIRALFFNSVTKFTFFFLL